MKLASLFGSSPNKQSFPANATLFDAVGNRGDKTAVMESTAMAMVAFADSPSPLVLVPGQRINSLTAPDFERELMDRIDEGTTDILLDFSAVTYISSAGLQVILKAGKRLKNVGGGLGLCSLNADCSEVFRITGFNTLFPIYASVEEALGTGCR
jgi:anti-anti-sigma factor